MKTYPQHIAVGIPPYQVTYQLQANQLLLQFNPELDDSQIDNFLHAQKLRTRSTESIPRNVDMLRFARMRCVILPRATESLSDFASDLLINYPEVIMAAPIYYAENQGPESAASPIPDTLVVRLRDPDDKETLKYLTKKFRLNHNDQMSNLLKPFHYFKLRPAPKPDKDSLTNVFDLTDQIANLPGVELVEFDWLKLETYLLVPTDTFWANQWDMARIGLVNAWDIQTGSANVWIAIIDSGFDLAHPDLVFTPNVAPNFTHFNAESFIAGNPPPYDAGPSGVPHGTACAGLAAATLNNATGVAGVAGGCSIIPVRLGRIPSAARVAAGLNWAATNGARVGSLSLGTAPTAAAITAVVNAWTAGMVLCAATGNSGSNTTSPPINFPANHANTIAVGASDQADQRKHPASADGECWWGSQFGPEIDVVAPGVLCWTTDEQGNSGYNSNNGGSLTLPQSMFPCIGPGGFTYPSTGDTAGDYFAIFNGTSAATPHVAGLAALLLSLYPTLTNVQVRDIIEQTAEKVGVVPYAETPGRPNGTWNQEMGYGRINVFRALDFADMMIKDWPGDTGIEPSSPPGGNFWDFSDIVIRAIDDNVFVPDDPNQSRNVERGQTNYIYIRVTNNGPREARNVVVNARIRPFVGLQFVYPDDWARIDAEHVSPTPVIASFAAIPSGSSAIAKFTISSAQVEDLWGWGASGLSWDPCLLAEVRADNDYAFATASLTGDYLTLKRNNLAQRNLSVVDVWAGASATFPFLAGSRYNAERFMEILVDRSLLPADMQLLVLLDDSTKAFPLVDLTPPVVVPAEYGDGRIVFLDRTRIETELGCCRGILTLEKGSRFDCLPSAKIKEVSVKGGEIIIRDNLRFVEIRDKITAIRISKQPNQLYPLALQASIPVNAQKGTQYMIRIAQRNEREDIVGGASVVYTVK